MTNAFRMVVLSICIGLCCAACHGKSSTEPAPKTTAQTAVNLKVDSPKAADIPDDDKTVDRLIADYTGVRSSELNSISLGSLLTDGARLEPGAPSIKHQLDRIEYPEPNGSIIIDFPFFDEPKMDKIVEKSVEQIAEAAKLLNTDKEVGFTYNVSVHYCRADLSQIDVIYEYNFDGATPYPRTGYIGAILDVDNQQILPSNDMVKTPWSEYGTKLAALSYKALAENDESQARCFIGGIGKEDADSAKFYRCVTNFVRTDHGIVAIFDENCASNTCGKVTVEVDY